MVEADSHDTPGRTEPWAPGDAILLREVWHGRTWRVNVLQVVEDGPERIALYLPRGAASKHAVDEDGRMMRIPKGPWTLADRVGQSEALALFVPGGRHSTWVYWKDDGSLSYWYVNFERPLRRTWRGFDYLDEKLDLVVQPDGTWRWKDEDELAEAAALGLVDAEAVWAEARRVLADPPWPTGWESWRPDPGWPTPHVAHLL